MSGSRRAVRLVGLSMALGLAGCAGQQTRAASSVVDYLYPADAEGVAVEPSIPTLALPVRVGIAFVPEGRRGVPAWASSRYLTEADKADLLERVATHFRKYEFVQSIEVIPSAYLTSGGSFANLDQIRTMYGTDVIALVSFDQVQFTDEGLLSLTYWTLVGAYVVSGEKNDTSTMLDTVVYDVPSRSLLFRAPGTSKVEGRSTPVNLSEALREDSLQGFREAATEMTANLDTQLARFRERLKEEPDRARIVHRDGSADGGALGAPASLALLLFAGLRRRGRGGCPEDRNLF